MKEGMISRHVYYKGLKIFMCFFVYILVPDQAPTEVNAVTTLSTSILLSWQRPTLGSINGILMNYLIKVKLNNSIVSTYNTSSTSTSYNITGLKKFTNYTFIVNIVNQIGEGPSAKIVLRTLADCKFFFQFISFSKVKEHLTYYNSIFYCIVKTS